MSTIARLYFLVGPSGAGKDTLLRELKKNQYAETQPLVAHRYITRDPREGDENHVELCPFDFNRRLEAGLFLFNWESHGYQYAIGREVKKWVKSGHNVIINGSREYFPVAREILPALVPIWISVSEQILRQRLISRGRETAEQIEQRILRNRQLESLRPKHCVLINNDQSIEDCVGQIIALTEMSNI
ncbi:MAG: ribose 1,5-bisphosphokinase [Gammaproteobacteria bacterium]|nr:ribose 1,5-bisphosphokinase [Gammaproteobacteria bacterium]MBL6999206.1 ribose 1,5-bisphosphokinase [Gammaproteobacteria bacterium]